MKTTRAFALLMVMLVFPLSVSAGTLGPAFTYKELLTLAGKARDGDVLLVSGDVTATGDPLKTPALLQISGDGKAAIRQLRVSDSSIVFSDIELLDSFAIDGVSNIELRKGVHVEGAGGKSGLTFSGSGTLLIDSECTVTGGSGATGITLTHRGGDLYVSIESSVRGGGGQNGGSGMEVTSLGEYGTMMLSGSIRGGDGTTLGGSGLNLFDLSGNAFVTVAGSVRGGRGAIGGTGMQLVSLADNVSVGVNGDIRGGSGTEYGGSALILMDASGASNVNLNGSLIGGDASSQVGEPGQSLQVVGDNGLAHAHVLNCLLKTAKIHSLTTPSLTLRPFRKSHPPSKHSNRFIRPARRLRLRLSPHPNRSLRRVSPRRMKPSVNRQRMFSLLHKSSPPPPQSARHQVFCAIS